MPRETRTYKQRAEYLKHAVKKRRKLLREKSINYLGGQCSVCGYKKCIEALEFHHINPSIKDFGISSKGLTRSWKKIQEELKKCILLCANCHREIHSNLNNSNDYQNHVTSDKINQYNNYT